MGTRNIPARQVDVCDSCGRGPGFHLQKCWVCGCDFCLTCQGQVTQCYGFTRLCCKCAELDKVKQVCHKFAKQLMPIFMARDEALKRLRGKRSATSKLRSR
jgi:hypothetical protein